MEPLQESYRGLNEETYKIIIAKKIMFVNEQVS